MANSNPELLASIAEALQAELRAFAPPLEIRKDTPTALDLYTTQQVVAFNKKHDGMYFASAIIQSSYVGFYFFPIYTHPDEFADLPAELRKTLKGKSCFHIKKLDDAQLKRIRAALVQGLELYRRIGWA